jgi:hypothetical protein
MRNSNFAVLAGRLGLKCRRYNIGASRRSAACYWFIETKLPLVRLSKTKLLRVIHKDKPAMRFRQMGPPGGEDRLYQ